MMLRHIAAATPTLDQMIDWVKRTFERAQSPITIKGYVGVLRMLGLAVFDGENLVLTPEGTQCLSGDSRKTIAAQLRARVAGISEILVATRVKPMTKQEIHSRLVEKLGTT